MRAKFDSGFKIKYREIIKAMAILNSLNPRGDLAGQKRYKQFELELEEALKEGNEIYNVSVSGGYGAGKSSLIKTFLNEKRKSADHILVSLASFQTQNDNKPVADSRVPASGPSSKEIEELILKHIIYSVNPSKIPRSKFSRLLPRRRSDFDNDIGRALAVFLIGLMLFIPENVIEALRLTPLTFQLIQVFDDIGSSLLGHILSVLKLIGIAAWASLAFPFVASLFWTLSKYSFNASVKIAGLEAAAERRNNSDRSYLNENIDELLYFFEMNTRKRLVVFEDLDRLKNPDIFVKLREINLLLNQYEGISEKVLFLYATRDDVFINSDRVKFFDLIIPVIPFVDNSNSYDIFLTGLEKLDISGLDSDFLRETSYFVNDYRLLQSIIGEFHYYIKQLCNPPIYNRSFK